MRVFGADENTLQPSVDYLTVLMLWFPFNSVFLGLNHLMRASVTVPFMLAQQASVPLQKNAR